jgi:2-hydroxycyclohexanecarboxyl-CoA dehydrogenase
MRGLQQKIALVTGAAGGIGRALCQRLVEERAIVMAIDRDEDALTQLHADQTSLHPLPLDITDYNAVTNAIATVEANHGPIDVLINNAGWDIAKPFVETTPDLWQKIVEINLYGPLNLHHAVLPGFCKRGQGKIVNIASDAARVGSSGEAVYAACKGGIVSFTKTIAREHARDGIIANVVCPGPTDTPLLQSFVGDGEYGQRVYEGLKRAIPLKRLGQPDDLPGIIAFLASDDSAFITGQVISVSGGLTMHG